VQLLLLLGLLGVAEARDEEPLRPEDAYRYAVTDTGETIEVDWAVEDGYYLYRNKLAFESATPAVVLGAARLPEGLTHEDEYFGVQQIYRGSFYVSIPYRVDGERPESFELVIESQGCADIGLCYTVQVWTADVPLLEAKQERLSLDALQGGAGGSLAGGTDEFPPPEEVFFPDLFAIDGNTVEVGFRIIPGFYLYKDKISVRSLSEGAMAGRLDLPTGKIKVDEFFGESEVYYDEAVGRLAIARATPEAMDLELEIGYQGCADGGLCYLPQTVVMSVSIPEATVVSDLAALPPGAPISEQGRIAQIIGVSPLWSVITAMFGFGLLLALTPCVLPMVPILTSIIAGEGDDVTPARGFGLSLSYVMGMAIVYTAAGVVAVAAGAQVQAAFNQPWVLTLFAGLFVVLAIAMFGAFDLQMPSAIQSRLAAISNNQKSGTMIGAFIMGALSSLIVTACVAPALVAALAVMSQSGDYLRGGLALFAMALGMGAPLLLVGAAQGRLLPKAGPWMVAIKAAFGFMLLGLAVWMLSRFLPATLILAMWAVLIFMVGVFMGGLTTLTPESGITQKLGKGFGSLAMIYGVLLVIGAATGGTNPLKPLSGIGVGAGTVTAAHDELPFRRIKTVADLDREIAGAAGAGKSVMLDFYADWCVSCKEMEAWTFTDAGVQQALSNTVWLQADVTANDAEDKALLDRFGVFGPPTIIFFGSDGEQRQGYEVVGYMKAETFAEHVRKAIAAPGSTLSARTQ
jgi:thiol:disulfide interchange protein DsbD